MKARYLSAIVLALALNITAAAQNQATPPAAGQGSGAGAGTGQGQGQGQGRRGGRGGWGGEFGPGGGRGLAGTVTEVAADHYTIKTEAGAAYTVHFSVNTRILKQQAQRRGTGEGQGGQGTGGERGGNPPQPIKPTDIKLGDAIAAMGEVDDTAKSVGAVTILHIDTERAKQMREMEANYGKTWLMGKVTAMDGVKVTLQGAMDKAPHTFIADENTTFRKRRDPITLADIQVGDTIRVEGAVKDGTFLATTVNAMAPPPAGTATVPRTTPPQ
jgi:hypothetical protein